MERIREAVQRARKDRGFKLGHVATGETPTSMGVNYAKIRSLPLAQGVLDQGLIIHSGSESAILNVYRLLQARVWRLMQENKWNTLAITSATKGEGKSLTAINLAISLARLANHTVFLADFDLQQPSIQQHLGYRLSLGLSDYVIHDAPLHDVLVSPGIEGLAILPGDREFSNSSSGVLSSPKLVQLIDHLRASDASHINLFDLPPLLTSDDVFALTRHIDAVLLVIEEGKTTGEVLTRARELLGGTKVLGSVLNKSEERITDYPAPKS